MLEKRTDFECPKCRHKWEFSADDGYDLVSYYGDDNIQYISCPECDHEFKVKEYVARWWDIIDE